MVTHSRGAFFHATASFTTHRQFAFNGPSCFGREPHELYSHPHTRQAVAHFTPRLHQGVRDGQPKS